MSFPNMMMYADTFTKRLVWKCWVVCMWHTQSTLKAKNSRFSNVFSVQNILHVCGMNSLTDYIESLDQKTVCCAPARY